jgi:hypothetical protein
MAMSERIACVDDCVEDSVLGGSSSMQPVPSVKRRRGAKGHHAAPQAEPCSKNGTSESAAAAAPGGNGNVLKERFKRANAKRSSKAKKGGDVSMQIIDGPVSGMKRRRGVVSDSIKSKRDGAASRFGFRSMFATPGVLTGQSFPGNGLDSSGNGPAADEAMCSASINRDLQSAACFPSQSAKDACQVCFAIICMCAYVCLYVFYFCVTLCPFVR